MLNPTKVLSEVIKEISNKHTPEKLIKGYTKHQLNHKVWLSGGRTVQELLNTIPNYPNHKEIK